MKKEEEQSPPRLLFGRNGDDRATCRGERRTEERRGQRKTAVGHGRGGNGGPGRGRNRGRSNSVWCLDLCVRGSTVLNSYLVCA